MTIASASAVASRWDSTGGAAALANIVSAETGATSVAMSCVGSIGASDDAGLTPAITGASALAVGAVLRGGVTAVVPVFAANCSSSDETLLFCAGLLSATGTTLWRWENDLRKPENEWHVDAIRRLELN